MTHMSAIHSFVTPVLKIGIAVGFLGLGVLGLALIGLALILPTAILSRLVVILLGVGGIGIAIGYAQIAILDSQGPPNSGF